MQKTSPQPPCEKTAKTDSPKQHGSQAAAKHCVAVASGPGEMALLEIHRTASDLLTSDLCRSTVYLRERICIVVQKNRTEQTLLCAQTKHAFVSYSNVGRLASAKSTCDMRYGRQSSGDCLSQSCTSCAQQRCHLL